VKHLASVLVPLTETRERYAYRPRNIGHLFEAEDESQEWPQLHAAIREAWKADQADGAVPNWETLAARTHERRARSCPRRRGTRRPHHGQLKPPPRAVLSRHQSSPRKRPCRPRVGRAFCMIKTVGSAFDITGSSCAAMLCPSSR